MESTLEHSPNPTSIPNDENKQQQVQQQETSKQEQSQQEQSQQEQPEQSIKEETNKELVTVFEDPINYNVKHRLQNGWTLWYDNPGKKANTQSWSQNLKQLITFDTVEDFWGVYNNVAKASELAMGSNYHLFKKDVRPMWEDPANAQGGKWSVQLPRNRTGDAINDMWLYTLLACIGEAFEHEEEICGCVVSVRKIFYRIALWVRTCEDREKLERVGRQLKATLGISTQLPVEFTPHSESAKSGPHANKERFSV
ncbi:uncharacterized protein VTP21DRAFT_5872 [Calcarisporiella thermophila]|uniref:uncharacterized protein n=1 Tax=Calcarisporiella thermophila TaxID=911321 RepID=UPI003743B554